MASLPWRRHRKRDIPGEVFARCPSCDGTIYTKDLEDRMKVCPRCDHHFPISSHLRIAYTLDPASFRELDVGMTAVDALGFVDTKPYGEKLLESAAKTGLREAMRYGLGAIEGHDVVFGTLEFRFMGGSMGVVVGEKVTRAIELAVQRDLPLVLVSASGGARMHEGILSLMQMAKTCSALAQFREANGFYVSICTHPTTGGVTASWAMAADVILAEPGALIGFAGPRVIEGTIKKKLPDDFQTAEFLLAKGQIDMIVPRMEMRTTLGRLLDYVRPRDPAQDGAGDAPAEQRERGALDGRDRDAADDREPFDVAAARGGGKGRAASQASRRDAEGRGEAQAASRASSASPAAGAGASRSPAAASTTPGRASSTKGADGEQGGSPRASSSGDAAPAAGRRAEPTRAAPADEGAQADDGRDSPRSRGASDPRRVSASAARPRTTGRAPSPNAENKAAASGEEPLD